jgi:hypothetical protein
MYYTGLRVQCLLLLLDRNETGFSRQNFEKYSNIRFHESSSSGKRNFPDEQTGRRDETNSRFSQICERA